MLFGHEKITSLLAQLILCSLLDFGALEEEDIIRCPLEWTLGFNDMQIHNLLESISDSSGESQDGRVPQWSLALIPCWACYIFSRLFECELIPRQKVRALAFHAFHFPLERDTLHFDPLEVGETCICPDSKPFGILLGHQTIIENDKRVKIKIISGFKWLYGLDRQRLGTSYDSEKKPQLLFVFSLKNVGLGMIEAFCFIITTQTVVTGIIKLFFFFLNAQNNPDFSGALSVWKWVSLGGNESVIHWHCSNSSPCVIAAKANSSLGLKRLALNQQIVCVSTSSKGTFSEWWRGRNLEREGLDLSGILLHCVKVWRKVFGWWWTLVEMRIDCDSSHWVNWCI